MNFSDETVNAISHWATIITLVCGITSAIAAVVMFWADDIKDNRLEATIYQARSEADSAKAELLALKTPRTLSNEQLTKLTEAAKPFAGQHFSGLIAPGGTDSRALWQSIANALIEAGWKIEQPDSNGVGNPSAYIGITTFEGVEIVTEYDAPITANNAALILSNTLRSLKIDSLPTYFEEYFPPKSETDTPAGFRRERPFAIELVNIHIGTKPIN